VLRDGAGLPVRDVLALAAWALGSLAAAARFFRWE
jgi:ABC-2 type transport system permease protein